MDRTLSFDVERRFEGGGAVRAAATLALAGGKVTVLFGGSGSGKTTLLRCLAGLDRPEHGFIQFGEERWFDARARRFVPPQRRQVGLLFQEYALFPHLSVEENIGFGLHGLGRRERADRVRAVAARMRVEELLSRRPSALSGGQRQRVALARTLATRPALLLLDEPLSALDAPTREALREELRRTIAEEGAPCLLVTHDRVEALALGQQVVVLGEGGVRQVGPVHEVFAAPKDAAVARVVGTENVVPVEVQGRAQGLLHVRAGALELVGVDPGGLEGKAYALIRAEDLILEPAPGSASSAQNLLLGKVAERADEGPLVRLWLDCGARMVALVTRASAERMGLVPGAKVAVRVKAPSVRLVPRAD